MPRQLEFDLEAIQAHVPQVYAEWARGHADGTVMTPRPYSPDDPYQRVENVRIEPDISLEQAQLLGRVGMGEVAYDNLTAGFEKHRVESLVADRHKKHRNTLIATLHLKNVLDTALTHNNLFVTSGGKPEIAEINDVLVNPMLAYLDIAGIAVYKALTVSGGIDEALPYRAAKEYGMNKEAREYIGRTASDALEKRLRFGVAIHWSLPGTRAKRIRLADGNESLAVMKVEHTIAQFAVDRLGEVVPVPINMHPGNAEVEVLAPRKFETVADVHETYEEMVKVISGLSGEQLYYGMPEGARLVSELDGETLGL